MDKNIPQLAQAVLNDCLCHNIRMASRVVSRAYDEALRACGLRATQVAVLAAVGAEGALSIKALADRLEMERTTLTRNLRPLEQQGFISISPEGRHRSRVVVLTSAGKLMLLKALPFWERAQQDSMRRLGVQRWPAVRAAYSDVRTMMQRASE